jgi:hypothetical protein
MTDLVVVVPSRGRPDAAAELVQVFAETCTTNPRLLFAVDYDDPTRGDYPADHLCTTAANNTMVGALNEVARVVANGPLYGPAFAVGFMGDDHRPRVKAWDQSYVVALRELGTGIVYGNDLLQGENLATQCAMTSDIVRVLGHMAPPTLRHMYVDNYWMDLGRRAGCLRYLPNVVVEHMHPIAGKSEWTKGHMRVNAQHMYTADACAYEAYVRSSLDRDVQAVKALRS